MMKAYSLLSSEIFSLHIFFLKVSDRKLEDIMLQSKPEMTQFSIKGKVIGFFLLI